jgi:hypothetical protein
VLPESSRRHRLSTPFFQNCPKYLSNTGHWHSFKAARRKAPMPAGKHQPLAFCLRLLKESASAVKMAQETSVHLLPTAKFSVWNSVSITYSIQDDEESDQPDPNSALSMLGGTFAMWMFADDGNPSDQMELPPQSTTTIPCALPLLHAVAVGAGVDEASTHAHALADKEYWQSLDEGTRGLYGGDGLRVGGQLPSRISLEDIVGGDVGTRALHAKLSDAGFAVVSPPLTNGHELNGDSGCKSPDWDAMARAVRTVEDHGWPPVFALMFDAPWAAVQHAWSVAAQVPACDWES